MVAGRGGDVGLGDPIRGESDVGQARCELRAVLRRLALLSLVPPDAADREEGVGRLGAAEFRFAGAVAVVEARRCEIHVVRPESHLRQLIRCQVVQGLYVK